MPRAVPAARRGIRYTQSNSSASPYVQYHRRGNVPGTEPHADGRSQAWKTGLVAGGQVAMTAAGMAMAAAVARVQRSFRACARGWRGPAMIGALVALLLCLFRRRRWKTSRGHRSVFALEFCNVVHAVQTRRLHGVVVTAAQVSHLYSPGQVSAGAEETAH